jgi:hypothetical protein
MARERILLVKAQEEFTPVNNRHLFKAFNRLIFSGRVSGHSVMSASLMGHHRSTIFSSFLRSRSNLDVFPNNFLPFELKAKIKTTRAAKEKVERAG